MNPTTLQPEQRSAPTRRAPIVIGVCPVCAGQGHVPGASFERTGQFFDCLECGGTGDLDAHRLHLAYEAGRQEVLRWFASAAANASAPELSIEGLKRKVDRPSEAA
jgi:hypothetical protein